MSEYTPFSQNHDPAFIDACRKGYDAGQSSVETFRAAVKEFETDVANLRERVADIDARLIRLEHDIARDKARRVPMRLGGDFNAAQFDADVAESDE